MTVLDKKNTHLVFSILSQLQADYSIQHPPKLPEKKKKKKKPEKST
jgi:hypothetical protein